jgi:glycosyltransferase involved in cell wall biosynthesis
MDKTGYVTFSFVIPTRGEQEKLNRCIESIRAASKLVNGECTIEILVIYSKDSNRIHIDENSSLRVRTYVNDNNNVSRARNMGIRASQGEYIILVDDDAYIGPEYFKVLNKYVLNNQTECICGRWVSPITGMALTRNEERIKIKYLRKHDFSLFRGTCIVIKKAIIDKAGFYSEAYGPGGRFFSAEESDLFFRLKKNQVDIFYVHDLVVYHPMEDEISRDKVYRYSYATGKLLLNQINKDKLSAPVYLYLFLRIFGICIIRLFQLLLCPGRIREKDNKHRYLYVLKGLYKACVTDNPLFGI